MSNSKIKLLPTVFIGRGEVKGYKFTQLGGAKKAFLYEVSDGDRKHYEVFKKKVNHRFACISYPSSESFGFWAWTYMKIEKAIIKYNELNNF